MTDGEDARPGRGNNRRPPGDRGCGIGPDTAPRRIPEAVTAQGAAGRKRR